MSILLVLLTGVQVYTSPHIVTKDGDLVSPAAVLGTMKQCSYTHSTYIKPKKMCSIYLIKRYWWVEG